MSRTILFLGALAAVSATAAAAAWQPTGAGAGAAHARTLPTGNTPSASVSSHDVTLTWTASTFAGGGAVPGYVIARYDALGNAQTVGASCSGIVSAVTCTESAVPIGTWQYTVTPAAGAWRGTEGPKSALVVVTL